MKKYLHVVIFSLIAFCQCFTAVGMEKEWDGKVLSIPNSTDPRFPDSSEENQDLRLMGPNYQLQLVAEVSVRNEMDKDNGDSLKRGNLEEGRIVVGQRSFAVGIDGSMYIALSECRHLQEGNQIRHLTPRIIKVSPMGEVLGTITGGLRRKPEMVPSMELSGWKVYTDELKTKECGFFHVSKIVPDAHGYLYLLYSDISNGCISVCPPDSFKATFLDVGSMAHPIGGIVYNRETGGVVVRDAGNPYEGKPIRWYVELCKGKIAAKDLPAHYLFSEAEFALELNAASGTLWGVTKLLSDDRETILSAKLRRMGTFALDLRVRAKSTHFIGKSDSGWVFDIRLAEQRAKRPKRAVLFYNGGHGYEGHVIPPASVVESMKTVGLDGKYYEVCFSPNGDTLRIYRAAKTIGTMPKGNIGSRVEPDGKSEKTPTLPPFPE